MLFVVMLYIDLWFLEGMKSLLVFMMTG